MVTLDTLQDLHERDHSSHKQKARRMARHFLCCRELSSLCDASVGLERRQPFGDESHCLVVGFDLVQAPVNLLDRRMVRSGWLPRLSRLDTALHVRSVFLQGLLLMPPPERPKAFDRWALVWREYDQWLLRASHKTHTRA